MYIFVFVFGQEFDIRVTLQTYFKFVYKFDLYS